VDNSSDKERLKENLRASKGQILASTDAPDPRKKNRGLAMKDAPS